MALQDKGTGKSNAAAGDAKAMQAEKQEALKAKGEKQEKISVLQKEVELLKKKVRELEHIEE